jgi:hypothetical protein
MLQTGVRLPLLGALGGHTTALGLGLLIVTTRLLLKLLLPAAAALLLLPPGDAGIDALQRPAGAAMELVLLTCSRLMRPPGVAAVAMKSSRLLPVNVASTLPAACSPPPPSATPQLFKLQPAAADGNL